MNDRIADMMIRIKNAGAVKKETVEFPYSKMKYAVCEVLKKEGFILNVDTKGKKVSEKAIVVTLKYTGRTPKISGTSRVSKFSKRVYGKATEIRPVKNGAGLLVLSTPKGILSGLEARKQKVGGELLLKVW